MRSCQMGWVWTGASFEGAGGRRPLPSNKEKEKEEKWKKTERKKRKERTKRKKEENYE